MHSGGQCIIRLDLQGRCTWSSLNECASLYQQSCRTSKINGDFKKLVNKVLIRPAKVKPCELKRVGLGLAQGSVVALKVGGASSRTTCSYNWTANEILEKRGQRIQEIAKKKTTKNWHWMAAAAEHLQPQPLPQTSTFNTDIKTPYSNLTAEVEWWHGSSRQPPPNPPAASCCRILMALRQRPQAPGEPL